MEDAAFRLHLVEFQAAGFRDAKAVAVHQEQPATVAGLVAAALGRRE
jgi:hypothetical protein